MSHEEEHQGMRTNRATVIGALADDMRRLNERVTKIERFLKSKMDYDPSKEVLP